MNAFNVFHQGRGAGAPHHNDIENHFVVVLYMYMSRFFAVLLFGKNFICLKKTTFLENELYVHILLVCSCHDRLRSK